VSIAAKVNAKYRIPLLNGPHLYSEARQIASQIIGIAERAQASHTSIVGGRIPVAGNIASIAGASSIESDGL
jgi:hypothetical protein